MNDNMNTIKKGLHINEACVYIGGVSRNTMYRLMKAGLPSYNIGNRRYFLISELDALIERRVEKELR